MLTWCELVQRNLTVSSLKAYGQLAQKLLDYATAQWILLVLVALWHRRKKKKKTRSRKKNFPMRPTTMMTKKMPTTMTIAMIDLLGMIYLWCSGAVVLTGSDVMVQWCCGAHWV